MRASVRILLILLLGLPLRPALSTIVLRDDIGGKMEDYLARFQRARATGETIVIDGPCYSACTMVLGLVPRNRLCVTANAVLGFHAAWSSDSAGNRLPDRAGTRQLMKTYPRSIRTWIAQNGGLRSDRMLVLRDEALRAVVKPCQLLK